MQSSLRYVGLPHEEESVKDMLAEKEAGRGNKNLLSLSSNESKEAHAYDEGS